MPGPYPPPMPRTSEEAEEMSLLDSLEILAGARLRVTTPTPWAYLALGFCLSGLRPAGYRWPRMLSRLGPGYFCVARQGCRRGLAARRGVCAPRVPFATGRVPLRRHRPFAVAATGACPQRGSVRVDHRHKPTTKAVRLVGEGAAPPWAARCCAWSGRLVVQFAGCPFRSEPRLSRSTSRSGFVVTHG